MTLLLVSSVTEVLLM